MKILKNVETITIFKRKEFKVDPKLARFTTVRAFSSINPRYQNCISLSLHTSRYCAMLKQQFD